MCRLTWSNDYLVIVHIIYKRQRKKNNKWKCMPRVVAFVNILDKRNSSFLCKVKYFGASCTPAKSSVIWYLENY